MSNVSVKPCIVSCMLLCMHASSLHYFLQYFVGGAVWWYKKKIFNYPVTHLYIIILTLSPITRNDVILLNINTMKECNIPIGKRVSVTSLQKSRKVNTCKNAFPFLLPLISLVNSIFNL